MRKGLGTPSLTHDGPVLFVFDPKSFWPRPLIGRLEQDICILVLILKSSQTGDLRSFLPGEGGISFNPLTTTEQNNVTPHFGREKHKILGTSKKPTVLKI